MARAIRRSASGNRGGLAPGRGRRISVPGETRVLRAVDEMRRDLRKVADVERAARIAVRNAASFFHADDQRFAVITPGVDEADLVSWTGPADSWDLACLGSFSRGERPEAQPGIAMARVHRRGRPWGAIALRWDGAEVGWDMRNALTAFAKGLNEVIAEIDRDRIAEVRSRIDRKVMEQLRPQDLFYQILDGLRSLARYDHSATILIGESDEPFLEVAAEKLAWRRGKSRRVKQRVELEPAELAGLFSRSVMGYQMNGDRFVSWDGVPADAWFERLAREPRSTSPSEPPVREVLVAPLSTTDGQRAVLVVSALHHGTFGEYEAALFASFLPQVSVALRISRRTEALEANLLATERKHAMADLARGVAHDVNNALGSIVPLLQQIRKEVREGSVDLETLAVDLDQIDGSVRVCRDIFGGMLRFARTAARPGGDACVRTALDACFAILSDSLNRHRITVSKTIDDALPNVAINQAELEQLVLNLVTNARDAMRSGGALAVKADVADDAVRLQVNDEGCGIEAANLERVLDPFYTTKPSGNGLGLSICRSIVWRSKGAIDVASVPDEGTSVTITLPAVRSAEGGPEEGEQSEEGNR